MLTEISTYLHQVQIIIIYDIFFLNYSYIEYPIEIRVLNDMSV